MLGEGVEEAPVQLPAVALREAEGDDPELMASVHSNDNNNNNDDDGDDNDDDGRTFARQKRTIPNPIGVPA